MESARTFNSVQKDPSYPNSSNFDRSVLNRIDEGGDIIAVCCARGKPALDESVAINALNRKTAP
jgi:hypothetical protein